MDWHPILGKTFANDSLALVNALEELCTVKSFEHIGNFVFRLETSDGQQYRIYTLPVDEDCTQIRVTDIHPV